MSPRHLNDRLKRSLTTLYLPLLVRDGALYRGTGAAPTRRGAVSERAQVERWAGRSLTRVCASATLPQAQEDVEEGVDAQEHEQAEAERTDDDNNGKYYETVPIGDEVGDSCPSVSNE